MFITEQPSFYTESEVMMLLQEAAADDPGVVELREELIIPIIQVLQKPSNVKKYIQYGSEFLEANAEMLGRQYPTDYVSYPRKYVDDIVGLFGWTVAELKAKAKSIFKKHISNNEFASVTESPTNIIHAIVMIYSDMHTTDSHVKNNRNNLRDSAKQQMGVTLYGLAMKKYFPSYPPNPKTMEYTYNRLDRSWDLVREENVINWIGYNVDTSFAFWRTKLALNVTPQILVHFLERVRTTIFQKLRAIANQYNIDMEAQNSVGGDVAGDDEYVDKREFAKLRNNLLRKIFGGDELYKKNGTLYEAIATYKNVKREKLYNFAQKVERADVGNIIDLILYVFITKEGNKIEDINSTKYINRITKFPTAIDRAIPGKPVVLPMHEKYKEEDNIIKAYICLVATYIMQRINDVT
jgi:hypothetical protein